MENNNNNNNSEATPSAMPSSQTTIPSTVPSTAHIGPTVPPVPTTTVSAVPAGLGAFRELPSSISTLFDDRPPDQRELYNAAMVAVRDPLQYDCATETEQDRITLSNGTRKCEEINLELKLEMLCCTVLCCAVLCCANMPSF
jgi:hypothetical protein